MRSIKLRFQSADKFILPDKQTTHNCHVKGSPCNFPPIEVHVESEKMAALICCATHKIVEATVAAVVADISCGADAIPKASQAVR